MIIENSYWYDVVPHNIQRVLPATGKWLYFDETIKLQALLPDLDKLVETGAIRSAKVARKHPDFDPFPEKPCVLCVFTADDPQEKERVRELLNHEFNISVVVWKSNQQTRQDWQEGGVLRVQAELNQVKRTIETGEASNIAEAREHALELSRQLQSIVGEIQTPDRVIELYHSCIIVFQKALQQGVEQEASTTNKNLLVSRLNRLENMMSSLLGEIDKSTESSTSGVFSIDKRTILRRQLVTYFSDIDLRELCFDLLIDYDDLPGDNKRIKVIELISHMERRGQILELVQLCKQLRPDFDW
jgi:hypothetical protein